jgi:hypothetical protein
MLSSTPLRARVTSRYLRQRRGRTRNTVALRVAFRGGARVVFYEHGGGEDTLMFVSPLAYGLAAIQPVLE